MEASKVEQREFVKFTLPHGQLATYVGNAASSESKGLYGNPAISE